MRGDTGSGAVVSEQMRCQVWAEGAEHQSLAPSACIIISATEQNDIGLEQPPSLWVSRGLRYDSDWMKAFPDLKT